VFTIVTLSQSTDNQESMG